MKTRTKWILGGAAVVGLGALLVATTASADEGPAPSGDVDEDGTFRFTGEELRDVACGLRDASSGSELSSTLTKIANAIRSSGAEQVDIRSTGVIKEVLPAADVLAELDSFAAQAKLVLFSYDSLAGDKVRGMLSGLPDCDAPIETWESFADGSAQFAMARELIEDITLGELLTAITQ